MSRTNKRALIIGCGIAGPAVALFLKRAGFEPIIYEALPETADFTGVFLNIALNGMRILHELGVDSAVRKEGCEMRMMKFRSGNGKLLGQIGGESEEPQGYTIKRGLLHKILREESERQGIPIEFGKRLAEMRMAHSHVTAYFSDESSVTGDIVVGCDGIHSATREIILPDAAQPSYTGLISFGGFARGVSAPYEPGVQHMVFGKKAFFGYLVKDNGEIYWFGNMDYPGTPTRRHLQAIPPSKWKEIITELYKKDLPPVPEIIARTGEEIGIYPIYDMLTQTEWYRGRAVVIGDAIHAVSPNAGQGASLALEDAMELAKCLRDIEDVELAFSKFQALRKERVERIVQYSRSIGKRKHVTNTIQVFFRDLMLPHFIKMENKRSHAWMYEYTILWDDPVQIGARQK